MPLLGISQNVQNNYLPDYYSSVVVNHLALVNPAWINTNDTKASFNVLYKSRVGLLNDVSTQTAYADVTFKPDLHIRQVARVIFQNEKEGPYIASPKFYGNYSIRIPITEDISISAGLGLGVSAHDFSAPSGTGHGSVPDAVPARAGEVIASNAQPPMIARLRISTLPGLFAQHSEGQGERCVTRV